MVKDRIHFEFNEEECVYSVKRVSVITKFPCTFCLGKGVLQVTGYDYRISNIRCPRCHGTQSSKKSYIWQPQKRYITGLYLIINPINTDKPIYGYYLSANQTPGTSTFIEFAYQRNLYRSLSEAEERCRQLNTEGATYV